MASNQPTKAIDVIPNDTINIPEPGSYLGGSNIGAGTTLQAVGTLFLDGQTNPAATGYYARVAAGDVVYEPSTGTIAQVESVDSNTQLTLSAPGLGGGAAFDIYRGNGGLSNNKQGQEGFSLFVGTAGDLTVIPAASEDPVVLKNVANNSYVPLQVIRVFDSGTTASDILALQLMAPTILGNANAILAIPNAPGTGGAPITNFIILENGVDFMLTENNADLMIRE